MKLNNKGMTLIELLLSIALIGIVLVFLLQLLNDLQYETDNNNFAYSNQVNRMDAIYTISNDLQKYTLVGVEDASANDNIIIKFYFVYGGSTKASVLRSDYNIYTDEYGDSKTTYYLRYTDYSGEQYSWEMKGAELDLCGTFKYYVDNTSNNYYFKINIPVYNSVYHERNNEDLNNAVDDIEITYSDAKKHLDMTNTLYLTKSSEVEKQIGICAN